MSTEIKNTLFRFVTMRAPELLEEKDVKNYFVEHPGDAESTFLAVINPMTDNRRKALRSAAAAFSSDAFKRRSEVQQHFTAKPTFYDFAVWLTKNRATLTVSETESFIGIGGLGTPIQPIEDESTLLRIWNELFYQIISFESGTVREALLSILVADFFLRRLPDVERTDEAYRLLAQARVIIPKEIFTPDTIPANSDFAFSGKGIKSQKRLVQLEDGVARLKKALAEVEKLRGIHTRLENKNYKNSEKAYNALVKLAYQNATKVEKAYLDPLTGINKAVIEYENLTLPTFTHTPLDMFNWNLYTVTVSKELKNIVKELIESDRIENFDDLAVFLKRDMQMRTDQIFSMVKLAHTMQPIGGTMIPTTYQNRASALFTIDSVGPLDQKSLVLVFDGITSDLDASLGEYKITFSDESELHHTSCDSYLHNGKLHIKIFNVPNGYFTAPEDISSFSFEGRFFCGSGNTISANGSASINAANNDVSIFDLGTEDSEFILVNNRFDTNVAGGGIYRITMKGQSDIDPDSDEGQAENENPNGADESVPGSVIGYVPSGYGIKRHGIADYRKVEQEVCCYVPGEVSHIENVMAREYKEKSTRRMRRQEDTLTTSKEKETEKLTDTTSTDRFEMNQELASVKSQQNSMAFGSQMSYDGAADITLNADFAHNTSQEQSNHQAVTHAQELTERALDRVVQKVKEERITKIIEEFEENNKHGFDNRKGEKHVSGVFRWVDKIYKNKVVNYGKRLMYEFMIPEPAAFQSLSSNASGSSNAILKPIDPRTATGLFAMPDFTTVNETTYAHWAAIYNAEVTAMPQQVIYLGKSFSIEKTPGDHESVSKSDTIKIPEGYFTTKGSSVLSGASDGDNGQRHDISVLFGDVGSGVAEQLTGTQARVERDLKQFRGEIPVSMQFYNYHSGSVNISIRAELSIDAYKQWQLETFHAIISAYEEQLDAYNKKVEEIKDSVKAQFKANPLFYRQIENTILRKNCVEYLVSQNKMGVAELLDNRGEMNVRVKYNSPDLETYAAKVKFIEQAFEWDLMSYNFYPFYWAKQDQWAQLYQIENDDALFKAFLQSGMARVIATVRPGFEEAVNWYMGTGQIWNGGQVPVMDDALFISIVKELQTPPGVVEETWESRVPTSLTVIQAGSIGLYVEGLPCDRDCEEWKQFDSDGNPIENPIQQAVDDNGNPVSLGNVVENLETVTEDISEIKDDIEEIKTALNIIQ